MGEREIQGRKRGGYRGEREEETGERESLYRYTAVIELTKIFKFGHPKSLLETFELSSRNNRNLIIVSAHKNSRSIFSNDFLTFLSTFDFTFDVICLSEAHLCMDKTYLDSDRFHINNYTRYKTFSTIKYGRCIIYVRDT